MLTGPFGETGVDNCLQILVQTGNQLKATESIKVNRIGHVNEKVCLSGREWHYLFVPCNPKSIGTTINSSWTRSGILRNSHKTVETDHGERVLTHETRYSGIFWTIALKATIWAHVHSIWLHRLDVSEKTISPLNSLKSPNTTGSWHHWSKRPYLRLNYAVLSELAKD